MHLYMCENIGQHHGSIQYYLLLSGARRVEVSLSLSVPFGIEPLWLCLSHYILQAASHRLPCIEVLRLQMLGFSERNSAHQMCMAHAFIHRAIHIYLPIYFCLAVGSLTNWQNKLASEAPLKSSHLHNQLGSWV